MKKKLLLIAPVMLLFVFAITLSSCFSLKDGGLLFTEVEGGYQVTGVALKGRFYKNFSVEIPSEYNGKPVVAISDYAFSGYSSLFSIEIPDSVKHIGVGAFSLCLPLQSVSLPDSLVSIGDSAFSGCIALKEITIPKSVTSIGNNAFSRCAGLLNINVDENNETYKSIDGNLFSKDGSSFILYAPGRFDSFYTIPDTVTRIENGAFDLSSWIDSIGSVGSGASLEIPDSVTSIGDNAFSYSSVKRVELSDYVVSIGKSAFSGCTSLDTVVFGNSLTGIGSSAFYGCTALKSVTLPSSLERIGINAFYNSALESVSIPDSIAHIDAGAFDRTPLVTNVYDNANYIGNEENPYVVLISAIDVTVSTCEIHSETKHIAAGAFKDCNLLESIILPDPLRSIGDDAFYNCDLLESIIIPDAVIYIGSGAFKYCEKLKNINIPDSVDVLGEAAFEGCYALEYNEYGHCKYLGNENNPYIALMSVVSQGMTSCKMHDNTKFIYDNAFEMCFSLDNIVIPGSVVSIGKNAFYSCSSLKNITIPSSVKTIGFWAFFGSTSLKTINFSGTVEEWGAIEKSSNWNPRIKATTIVCSDGTVYSK